MDENNPIYEVEERNVHMKDIKVNVELDDNEQQMVSVTIEGMGAALADEIVRKAKISVSKDLKTEVETAVHGILATLNEINTLDFQDTSVMIGDALYPLADYKVSEGWTRLILPRKVAISSDFRSQNLASEVIYEVDDSANPLTPGQFREAIATICVVFKSSYAGTTYDWTTSAIMMLKEDTPVSNGVAVSRESNETNDVVPVFLKANVFYKPTYYIYDLEEYIRQGIFNLVTKWRS